METFRIRAFVRQEGGKSNCLEFNAAGAYMAGQKVEHCLRLFAGSVGLAITVDERPEQIENQEAGDSLTAVRNLR